MRNQKAYALVMVLGLLVMASLVGSFFLKKAEQRAELSQLNLSERALRVKVASDFNRVAQAFGAYVEEKLGDNPDSDVNLLGDHECSSTNSSPCFDLSQFEPLGVQSVNIRCLSQGAGSNYNNICDTSEIFPKVFLMELQIRSLERRDLGLSAAGEIMFAPTPLNAYSRATAGISEFGVLRDAEYKGNVALNFCAPVHENLRLVLRPSHRPSDTPANSGLGIISFSEPIITNRRSALSFDTDAGGSKIIYPGLREIGLDGILGSFRAGMEEAMGSDENQVFNVRERLTQISVDLPEALDLTCQDSGAGAPDLSPTLLSVDCELTDLAPTFWLEGSLFRVSAERDCFLSLSFEQPEDFECNVSRVGLDGWDFISCTMETAGDGQNLSCDFNRANTEVRETNIGADPTESNIFVFSEMPEVIFDRVESSLNTATAAEAFAIYVPDGRVNLMRPFKWGSTDPNRLGGSFFARDGFFLSRITNGDNGFQLATNSDFTFDATLVALEGPPPPNDVEIVDFFPPALPTDFQEGSLFRAVQGGSFEGGNFRPATNRVHFCVGDLLERSGGLWVKRRRPSTINLGDLLEYESGWLKLGSLKLKGGMIGSELNTLRLSQNNQVIAGFQNVESVFLPNDSPPLIQRVFVSDLMTTVLNLNIHISDPRAAMDEVGLTWEAPQPDD